MVKVDEIVRNAGGCAAPGDSESIVNGAGDGTDRGEVDNTALDLAEVGQDVLVRVTVVEDAGVYSRAAVSA